MLYVTLGKIYMILPLRYNVTRDILLSGYGFAAVAQVKQVANTLTQRMFKMFNTIEIFLPKNIFLKI